METYGAVIGRFQVDQLHFGHMLLLLEARSRHDKLIVFIGDRNTPPTATNPLSFQLRQAMIKAFMPDAIIVRLWDHPSNEVWSKELDELVNLYTNDVTFYTGRDSFKPYYSGKFEVVSLDFGHDDITATEIRNSLKSIPEYPDNIMQYFRAGVIHARNTAWHRTHQTVDMALIRYDMLNGLEVCLVRKPGETQWQFPGGFVDRGETFEEAAAREMIEETGLASSVDWDYMASVMIDDWRLRGVHDADHRTVLMMGFTFSKEAPVPQDDVEEAKFFNLLKLFNDNDIVKSNHMILLERLQKTLDKKLSDLYILSGINTPIGV
jgi:bifunctional NMN adenylyltransferase/nudix hydrolase